MKSLLVPREGVDGLAARVAERFASKKFDSMFDLQLFMESLPGWKRVKGLGERYITFAKRIGNVSVEVGWDDSHWNKDLFVMAPISRNVAYGSPEYEDAKDKLFLRLRDVPGKSWHEIEVLVVEVAATWKGLFKRQKKDRSKIRYQPDGYGGDVLQGDEAFKRWLKDVEAELQDGIDRSAKRGMDWTTQQLVEDILDHGRLGGLIGVSRRDMGNAISRLLNAMARAGKIEKDTNNPRVPKWLGLDYVPRQRPSW